MTKETSFLIAVAVIAIATLVGIFYFADGTRQNRGDVVLAEGHYRGPENAPVTIVEFADMSCPACATVPPIINEVLARNPDNVRLYFRHFPLPIPGFENSPRAAYAAEAAANQNKFFEYKSLLFQGQSEWKPSDAPETIFERYAQELGLDLERFRRDYESQEVRDRVARDERAGDAHRVDQTPTFFINGTRYTGNRSVEDWQAIIDAIVAGQEPPAN